MSAKKISVIIPVYNSANHLTATLDSLACQTMQASDFEIICVNDCSTDNSRQVLEEWAEKRPNLKLINLPKNTGGPMIPRNVGMEAAVGRYIHFMDSDDFLGEEALERLYNAAEQYNSDVIFGRYVGVNGRGVPKSLFGKGNRPNASLYSDNILYSLAPHKMVRTSFIKTNGLQFFPEAKAPNEDQLFIMNCYIKAGVITLLDDYDYYYVVARGNENFSTKPFPPDEYFYVPHHVLKLIDEQISDTLLNKKAKSIYLRRFLLHGRLLPYLTRPAVPLEQKHGWLQEAKRFFDTYLNTEVVETLSVSNQRLIELIRAGNLEAIKELAKQKVQTTQVKKKGEIILATAKSSRSKAYLRPSVNALPGKFILQPEKPFPVFASVSGWLEVRQPDKEGGTYAAFVNRRDVRFSFSQQMKVLFRRLQRSLKKKQNSRRPPAA